MKYSIHIETNLKTSWMRKLNNRQFTSLMFMIAKELEESIDPNGESIREFNDFMQLNEKLQQMRPKNIKHSETQIISDINKDRISLLVHLSQMLKVHANSKVLKGSKRVMAGKLLELVTAYGSRYYDMAMFELTCIIEHIQRDLESNSDLKDALDDLKLNEVYDEIIRLNNELQEVQSVRTKKIVKMRLGETYVEARRKINNALRFLIYSLELNQQDDLLAVIKVFMDDFKFVIKQREASRRAKAKAKTKTQEVEETKNEAKAIPEKAVEANTVNSPAPKSEVAVAKTTNQPKPSNTKEEKVKETTKQPKPQNETVAEMESEEPDTPSAAEDLSQFLNRMYAEVSGGAES